MLDILNPIKKPDYKRYWVAAAISGAAALGSTALNYFGSQNKLNKQTRLSKELYNYQLEKQAELQRSYWQQYNSPAAQMAAYRKAGLNPNLVAQYAGPSNQSVPNASMSTPEVPNYGEVLGEGIRNTGEIFARNLIAERNLAIQQQNANTREDVGQSTINLNLTKEALNGSLTALNQSKKLGVDFDLGVREATKDAFIEFANIRNKVARGQLLELNDRHEKHEFDKANTWSNEASIIAEKYKQIKFDTTMNKKMKKAQLNLLRGQHQLALANAFLSYQNGKGQLLDNMLFGDTYQDRKDIYRLQSDIYAANYNRLHLQNEYLPEYLKFRNTSLYLQNEGRELDNILKNMHNVWFDKYGHSNSNAGPFNIYTPMRVLEWKNR